MAKKEIGEKAEKTNLYLLAIVAIVAVVGIVVMILNSAGSTSLSSSDYSGQALKIGSTSKLSAGKLSTGIGKVSASCGSKTCPDGSTVSCSEADGVCVCGSCTHG
ncbi:hypothetical protein HZA99_04105 [Candidatus Woesearchaeota archaeon]|nr:hypothetical protein [Candidatus Woesearchaeota archaeon]